MSVWGQRSVLVFLGCVLLAVVCCPVVVIGIMSSSLSLALYYVDCVCVSFKTLGDRKSGDIDYHYYITTDYFIYRYY